MKTLLGVARPLAPEDIAVHSYVAVLTETVELLPFWIIDSPCDIDRVRPVRWSRAPVSAGWPLKVIAVCLPFVLVKSVRKDVATLDVRQCALAELSPEYVDAVRKQLGKSQKQSKRDAEFESLCELLS